MNVAHLSDLLIFLEGLGVHPKKSLSQNFLIDANIVRKIVALANIQEGDLVLEIGPGPGALTTELLKRGAFVTAIEKDSTFAKELHRLQNDRLTVIEEDILQFNWNHLPSGSWKVIGNLPYSITTPILELVCSQNATSFTFMVQKELAERLLAPLGSRECGSISVFVQSHGQIKGSFHVPKSCFYPSPQVDSSVLCLEFHSKKEPSEFFSLVRAAFQQRRKMIASSLKKFLSKEQIELAGIPTAARPETLSLTDWQKLFHIFCSLNEKRGSAP